MGLFAGSNWGKMRMFWTDKGYFMTLRRFSTASAVVIAVRVPQNSTPARSPIDNNPISCEDSNVQVRSFSLSIATGHHAWHALMDVCEAHVSHKLRYPQSPTLPTPHALIA